MGTLDFYDADPEGYFDRTFGSDMSPARERFTKHLSSGARILDLGSGSCRDTEAFIAKGFDAVPVDGSAGMRLVAKERLGIEVLPMDFADIPFVDEFDGVWASASLLHVPSKELPGILCLVHRALREGGAFYCSFKYGDFEGLRDGRMYTDMTGERLERLLISAGFSPIDVWRDRSSGGTEWVHAVSIRQRYHRRWTSAVHEDGWESCDSRHRRG